MAAFAHQRRFGSMLDYSAEGANDDPPALTSLLVQHLANRPPAPVHGRWWREGAEIRVQWTRRSRASAPWQDFLDMPLGEAAERYRVDGHGTVWEVTTPAHTLAIADLPGPVGGKCTLSIRQIGDTGVSEPLIITIPVAALV